jgi:Ketopantoate reductase PanE/ApbA
MHIFLIGAGSLGGYFGGCLIRAGRDVTFMVHLAAVFAFRGDRIERRDTRLSDVPMVKAFFGLSRHQVCAVDTDKQPALQPGSRRAATVPPQWSVASHSPGRTCRSSAPSLEADDALQRPDGHG